MTRHHTLIPAAGVSRSQGRWESWLNRFGPPGSIKREVPLSVSATLLTAGLLAFNFGYAVPAEGPPVDRALAWAVSSIACLQGLLLVLRRRYPLVCFVAVMSAQLILVIVPDFTIRGPALVVAAYTIGTLWSARQAQLAAGLAVLAELLLTVVVVFPGSPDLFLGTISGALGALATYGLPVLAGAAMATRRRYTELLAERAADAVAAQRATVQAALVAERTRMARELHDVAAHHLSGMVVQAAAVERLVDRDPSAAKAGAAWIRGQGRETLDNLRLTVGMLRDTSSAVEGDALAGAPAERAPIPGLAALDELVHTARELGTSVSLVRRGPTPQLPPIADIAFFRVAQEALSNARQHAPGAEVTVLLESTADQVRLRVADDGSPPATRPRRPAAGVGLIGMRERADLIGADFTAGARAGGGWQVEISVPIRPLDQAPVSTPDQDRVS